MNDMKNSQKKKDAKLRKFPWIIEQLHKKNGNSKIPIEKHLSHVQVGRGNDGEGHLGIWAGAVSSEGSKTPKK